MLKRLAHVLRETADPYTPRDFLVRLPQPSGICTAILIKAGCIHDSSVATIATPQPPPTPMSPPPSSLVPSLSPTPPCPHHVHANMLTKYWRRNANMEAGMVEQYASPSTVNSTVAEWSRLRSSFDCLYFVDLFFPAYLFLQMSNGSNPS